MANPGKSFYSWRRTDVLQARTNGRFTVGDGRRAYSRRPREVLQSCGRAAHKKTVGKIYSII